MPKNTNYEKTVLLMDDEPSIQSVMKGLIEHLGCEMHSASHGQEAIEMYIQAFHKQIPYSLVLLDLTVKGGKGGKETIKELLEFDPEVNAIIMSGSSNDPVFTNYQAHGFNGILKKPFTLTQLKQILNNNVK
ncbi:MAG: response regulator [Candidatus Kariarchaeaceae archaeon]|jgi:CheY-like chemotaxis protein